jgi:O-antigen ligase
MYENHIYSPALQDEALFDPYAQAPARGFVFTLLIGLIWGLGTGFSAQTDENTQLTSGATLLLVFGLFTFIKLDWVFAWLGTWGGWMLAIHGIVAVFSGIVNQSHPAAILRYLLLLPCLSLLLATIRIGPAAVEGMRAGLTWAAFGFVFYHILFVDFASLSNPNYRINLFMNPNGVGFISAMCAASMLDYALRIIARTHRWLSIKTGIFFAAVLLCAIVCFATKSRTASIVFFMAMLVRLYLSLGLGRALLFGIGSATVLLVISAAASTSISEEISEIFQLTNKHRGITGGTGRFAIWSFVIRDIWLNNFLYGVGPAEHLAHTAPIGASSAHNGMLAYLADLGLLGAAPIMILIVICAKRAFRLRRNPHFFFAITIFAAGMVESIGETMFFSFGNPASLLFLFSVAMLSIPQYVDPEALPLTEQQHAELAYANY